jgi:hypothetical protein
MFRPPFPPLDSPNQGKSHANSWLGRGTDSPVNSNDGTWWSMSLSLAASKEYGNGYVDVGSD